MNKLKIGVIYGGMSTENEVSIMSAKSVIENLDTNRYEIFPIYISKNAKWYNSEEENEEIKNIVEYIKNMDVIFPVLHGLYGEDGTIQGLLEMLKIPYVGCKVLASSVGMDKVYTKILFEKAGIKQAKYQYIKKIEKGYVFVKDNFEEHLLELDEIIDKVQEKLKYPMFVKPSNSGSSVGVNKANNKQELKKYIEEASKFDKKILIEEGIIGKEVECAVLGNEDVLASCVGEVKSAEEFYSYDAKYNNKASITEIPAKIPREKSEEIRKLAVKAFKAIDGTGLSRVDFFIENETNRVYVNEINTLPGFTNISMYPKLFEAVGISYKELLNRLIQLAQQ